MLPKISIITPSFNQASYIEQTIRSVESQNYPNFEHIIIDGGSTDDTVEILKRFPHLVWVSEKDEGQADALRKGFERVTGDIVGWLNSDDYYEPDVFKNVAHAFEDPNVNWLVGNLTYVFHDGEFVPDQSPEITQHRLWQNPDIIRQQSTFFRKDFLSRAGGWNPEFHLVMDYDLWLRLSVLDSPATLDANIAYFRMHAEQKTALDNYIKQSKEIDRVLARDGAPIYFRLISRLKKRWIWFKGHIKAFCVNMGLISGKYRHRPVRLKARDLK